MMKEFDRKIWESHFYSIGEQWDEFEGIQKINTFLDHPIPCPQCWDPLHLNKPKLFYNGDYDAEIFMFSCELKCKNCGHIILGIGEAKVEEQDYPGEKGYQVCSIKKLYPKYFFPNLRLFYLKKYFPKPLAEILDRSFSLFYGDISTAISLLRTFIEQLLDHEKAGKIPRERANGSFKTLKDRVDLFKEKNPDIADQLEPFRNLGNLAIHSKSKKMWKKEYLDLLEIIYSVLIEIFGQKEIKRPSALAKKYNKKYRKIPK